MKQSEALFLLMRECERIGVSFELEYDNGKRIPGKYYDLPEAEKKKHIEQGPKGWTIEIAGYFHDKDGEQELYSDINRAISSGIYLLQSVLEEKGEMSDFLKMVGVFPKADK